MTIVGFNVNTIRAEIKKEHVDRGINISSTPTITNIEPKNIPGLSMSGVLSFSFDFTTKYEPDVGEIFLSGNVLYQQSETKAKKILDAWEKDKKVDDDAAVDVLNAIMRRCIAKGIELAVDLRLPPPITFPRVTKAKK